jgi:hypothetical protein
MLSYKCALDVITSTELVRGNFSPIYIDFESKLKRKIKCLVLQRENF